MVFDTFKLYVFGGGSFLLSHAFMGYALHAKWSTAPRTAWLLMIPGFVLYGIFLLPCLMKGGFPNFTFFAYMNTIMYAASSAATRCGEYGYESLTFLLPYIGYQFFIISDIVLLRKKSTDAKYATEWPVMGTYIIAQILISVGLGLQGK